MHLGVAQLQQGDLIGAQQSLEASLRLAKALGRQREARDVHEQMVLLHERGGAYDLALAHCKEQHRLDRQLLNETLNQHTQSLLIQHDVESHRQLNAQLQRSNQELALLYEQNQELLTCVQHQMLHDPLTGLPNRSRFELCLADALAAAEASGLALAVMFIDLDGFKKINDTLGHDAGDDLLVQVAARFTALMHPDDLVARLSGDEFVAFVGALKGPFKATTAAQRFLRALDDPFEVRGQAVSVSASIGVSVYPDDGQDIGTLQRCADEAMYRVKRSGKSAMLFYSAS
ncbi:hypothetical protein GCM10008957_52210 [Deinococcus ruber]|uniref:GGDEF domain-containing protein n=2 Tax=Deinococcus ruber TaxID=1848197 RepID=A0A918KVU9_9DEIO|nr:hypothetical protein GCM10008957_52210 [Deinococcus ruber]